MRAFIAERYRGRKGRVDFAEAAVAYKALGADSAERLRAQELGNMGRRSAKRSCAHLGRSVFGVAPRDAKRQAVSSAASSPQALAIAEGRSDSCEQRALLDLASATNESMASRIRKGKQLAAARNRERRRRQAQAASKLVAWEQGDGRQAALGIEERLPNLPKDVLSAVPSTLSPCFEARWDLLGPVGRCTEWCHRNAMRSNLPTFVDAAFTSRCQTLRVGFGNTAPHQPPAAPPGHSKCRAFGRCTNDPAGVGREIWRFRNAVLRRLKAQCPRGSQGRADLHQGFIVLRFVGHPSDAVLGAGDAVAVADATECEAIELFAQVGLQYWSPYRPTYQIVERVVCPPGEAAAVGNRIYVKAPRASNRSELIHTCQRAQFESLNVRTRTSTNRARAHAAQRALAAGNYELCRREGCLRAF